MQLQQSVTMMRNPFHYSTEVFKQMWKHRRHKVDDPKLNLGLSYHVHPTTAVVSQWLEYCVLRLQFATEMLLARYASEVITKHIDLLRLADCIIQIYGMTACLSRASRSYCIGLHNSEYDITMATAFCLNAMDRVKDNVSKVYSGPYNTNDSNYAMIGKKIVEKGGYFLEHPTAKNY